MNMWNAVTQTASASLSALAPEIANGAANAAGDVASHAGPIGVKIETGPLWAMAVPLLPLLGFVLCGLFAAFKVKSKLPAYLTVGVLAASFAVILAIFLQYFMGNESPRVMVTHVYTWLDLSWTNQVTSNGDQHFKASFGFYLDSLTVMWMLFVTFLATMIALYASEYMSHDVGLGYCRFFAAFNLFVFSMASLVMADNLVLMFLGWEGVGLCSYLLIGYFYKRDAAVAAAKKAFIVNRIADLFLLLGLMSVYVAFGTVEYAPLFEMIRAGVDGKGAVLDGTWIEWVIPLLLTIGAFGKSAQIFFYVWLPDAMEGPTPVSALIHAATMVTAGVFLIARMYPLYTIDDARIVLSFVAWSGAITALWAATIEMAIFDIKRVMGYSTISQLGFMFAALGVLAPEGAAFHVFTHAFFKATLFLCVGAVMHGFGGQLDLRKMSGVAWMKGFGIVGIGMFIGSINLSGVPFTAGYFSKDVILAGAFASTPGQIAGSQWIAWILLLTAGMTAYYTFRTFFRVYVGPKEFTPGQDVELIDLGRHPKGESLEHFHTQSGHAHSGHGHSGHGQSGHGQSGHGTVEAMSHGALRDFDPTTEEFDPHPPGAAMKIVMITLMLATIASAALYFVGGTPGVYGGWAGTMVAQSSAAVPLAVHDGPSGAIGAGHGDGHTANGTFLGLDPHKAMYFVSAAVGFIGIAIAAILHGPKGWQGLFLGSRTIAARSRADALVPLFGKVAVYARNKWYVDEIYDALIRNPLKVLARVFSLIDQYVIDGLVNLVGVIPRAVGTVLRPSQNGEIHGYAAGMAGGIAVIIVLVLLVTTM